MAALKAMSLEEQMGLGVSERTLIAILRGKRVHKTTLSLVRIQLERKTNGANGHG